MTVTGGVKKSENFADVIYGSPLAGKNIKSHNSSHAISNFQIDLTKMPLGKLSKKQIGSAYAILTEVQEMFKSDSGTPTKFLDASNRFFTLIPHDFGMKSPPLLDNPDFIR